MEKKVFVIIPCYKVKKHIEKVIAAIGNEVHTILVVDDCCPEESGHFVKESVDDPRVIVIFNEINKGVGGAIIAGYRKALELGATICVKVDGDGQMDPKLIPSIIKPILSGQADYVKGNRFYSLYDVSHMPKMRLFGNTILSFMSKFSSGYWSLFDPTNGFTAIHSYALSRLALHDISERYFFESDMLIALGGIRAVVVDMPMRAVYADETSNLKIRDVTGIFLYKHTKGVIKRLIYSYYLRDFSLASINLPIGILLLAFGVTVGITAWHESIVSHVPATSGTVILSALPVLLGIQFILSFFSFDIANEPKIPLQSFDTEYS